MSELQNKDVENKVDIVVGGDFQKLEKEFNEVIKNENVYFEPSPRNGNYNNNVIDTNLSPLSGILNAFKDCQFETFIMNVHSLLFTGNDNGGNKELINNIFNLLIVTCALHHKKEKIFELSKYIMAYMKIVYPTQLLILNIESLILAKKLIYKIQYPMNISLTTADVVRNTKDFELLMTSGSGGETIINLLRGQNINLLELSDEEKLLATKINAIYI